MIERGNEGRLYVSDMIGESEMEWIYHEKCNPEEIMLIEAGTGTGKSTFAIDVVTHFSGDVLYLVPRRALKKEIYSRLLEKDGSMECSSNKKVCTYQEIEDLLKHGKTEMYKWWEFFDGLIIVDEFHYFMQDSDFNADTYLSYNFIKSISAKKIFLSGTGYGMRRFRLKNDFTIVHYHKSPADYSHIQQTYFYPKIHPREDIEKDFALNKIKEVLQTTSEEKVLYFVNSMNQVKKLYADEEIRENADFYFSLAQGNNKDFNGMLSEDPFVQDEYGQTFKKRVLITTKVLDVGIDLKDRELKHIFIDIDDLPVVVQCMGRKRVLDNLDTCNLYIAQPHKWQINKNLKLLEKAIKKAELQKKILNGELSMEDDEYKRFLEEYMCDSMLDRYECTYEDWIYHPGQIMFNEIRYSRLQELRIFQETIIDEGYIELFKKLTKIKNIICIQKEQPDQNTNIAALQLFINEHLGEKLFKEQQEQLIQLCSILDSRRRGYVKQPSRISTFLSKFNVYLNNVRNKPYWIIERN